MWGVDGEGGPLRELHNAGSQTPPPPPRRMYLRPGKSAVRIPPAGRAPPTPAAGIVGPSRRPGEASRGRGWQHRLVLDGEDCGVWTVRGVDGEDCGVWTVWGVDGEDGVGCGRCGVWGVCT